MKKRIFILLPILLIITFITSCYTPSPLYGNWADNKGNKITFVNDGSFTATIIDSTGTKVVYEGSYTTIDNVLVFSTNNGLTVNTEWDIRGSILYLTWTDGITYNLTLYHTSK